MAFLLASLVGSAALSRSPGVAIAHQVEPDNSPTPALVSPEDVSTEDEIAEATAPPEEVTDVSTESAEAPVDDVLPTGVPTAAPAAELPPTEVVDDAPPADTSEHATEEATAAPPSTPAPSPSEPAAEPDPETAVDLPITLSLAPGPSVTVGTAVRAQALWPERAPAPAGSVRYSLVRGHASGEGAVCSVLDGALYASAGEATVGGGGAAVSDAVIIAEAGDFSWVAAFVSGSDAFAAKTVCAPLVVARAIPALTLALPADTAVAGEPVQATATLDGGFNATAGVTVTVFAGEACAGIVHSRSAAEVDASGVASSEAVEFSDTGTYSWRATYAGDANNEASASGCIGLVVSDPAHLSLTIVAGSETSFGAVTAPTVDDAGVATYMMTDAVTVEVTGGGDVGPWVVTCTVAGGSAGMRLEWQLAGSSEWTPFTGGPCFTAEDGGDMVLTYNYRLRVDPTARPGPFAFDVTFEVSPL